LAIGLLFGVATLCAATAAPPLARVRARARHACTRACRRLRPPHAVPVGPPIEQIAADLRRLQAWLDRYADPRPSPGKATKLTATLIAYDRVLAEACRALEIPESLAETHGLEHEAERLRVQAALREVGFVLATPHRAG